MDNRYYHTTESVHEYIELAKDVDSRGLIEKLQQVLPTDSRLLEIGSGPGTDWRILNAAYQVVGSDNSQLFVEHLRTNNPNGEFLRLDAITLATELKFDGIYSNKVLHHLNDSEISESLKNQHRILAPGGIICHSFWLGDGSEVFKGMYVNYQTEETLRVLFEKHFELLTIETYKEFEEADSLCIIARKTGGH